MTIDDMNKIKETRGYSFAQLAEYTGVPVVTLQRVLSGATKHPRKATLDAIEKVLTGDEAVYSGKAFSYGEKSSVSYMDMEPEQMELRENEPEFRTKKNGEYTIEDYYALPEEKWVELIDGCFYDMTAPTAVHQIISGLVFYSIYNYIRSNNGACVPIYSPVDVQLDCDDKTMVQPDVIIVCNEEKIKGRVIYGAPDFVLEILSPSTRRKDMFIKAQKYFDAGVKEYWMIDPKNRLLIVYNCTDEDAIPVMVPLEGEYPLFLYDGRLKINLDEIAEAIDRFS